MYIFQFIFKTFFLFFFKVQPTPTLRRHGPQLFPEFEALGPEWQQDTLVPRVDGTEPGHPVEPDGEQDGRFKARLLPPLQGTRDSGPDGQRHLQPRARRPVRREQEPRPLERLPQQDQQDTPERV